MATKKTITEPIVIKGFKGFDKNLKCRDKKYELGKEFTEPDAKICEKGLHFCENPLDIFNYYSPANSRFAEVEGTGKIDKKVGDNEDTKVSCTTLKIGAEISLQKIIEGGVKFILERTKITKSTTNKADKKQASNSGDYGAASNSGYKGADSNSGNYGAASNSGYKGAASNSGNYGAALSIGNYATSETDKENSVAIGVGYDNKVKGCIGSWLTIAERNDKLEILNMQSVKVDGKKVKADTWYNLVKGKLIIVK